jgi:hypothetical protein
MAQDIDEQIARHGTLDPKRAGINQARAADRDWYRNDHESEPDFLNRVRSEAKAEGFRVVEIFGVIATYDDT